MITPDYPVGTGELECFTVKRFKHEKPFATKTSTTNGKLPLVITGTGSAYSATIAAETVLVDSTLAIQLGAQRSPATETTTIGETLSRLRAVTSAPAAETVTISEASLTERFGANRSPANESVSIAEALQRQFGGNVEIFEFENPVTVSDALARNITVTRPTATETTAIAESVVKVFGAVRAPAAETVSIIDGYEFTDEFNTLEFNAGGNGFVTTQAGFNRSPSTETVSISDGVARIVGFVAAITENISIGESLARVAGFVRGIGPEVISIIDLVARDGQSNYIRNIATEVVTITALLFGISTAARRASRHISTATRVIVADEFGDGEFGSDEFGAEAGNAVGGADTSDRETIAATTSRDSDGTFTPPRNRTVPAAARTSDGVEA